MKLENSPRAANTTTIVGEVYKNRETNIFLEIKERLETTFYKNPELLTTLE